MKIKLDKYVFAIFCIVIVIFNVQALPYFANLALQGICHLYLLIFLVSVMKLKDIFNISLLLCIPIWVSTSINFFYGNISEWYLVTGMLYGLVVFETYGVLRACIQQSVYETIRRFSVLFCTCAIINVLWSHLFASSELQNYFFGNKFISSYIMLFALTLYRMKSQYDATTNQYYKRAISAILLVLALDISIYTECSTTIVGCLILAVLLIFEKTLTRFVMNRGVIIGMIGFAAAFVYFCLWILQNEWVQYVIENILHEDVSLTGRVGIYKILMDKRLDSSYLGHGYGNIYINRFYPVYNLQNAFFQLWNDYGVVMLISFSILIFYILYAHTKKSRGIISQKIMYPIYSLMLVFICMGMVEIVYDALFWMILFFIENLNRKWSSEKNQELNVYKSGKEGFI